MSGTWKELGLFAVWALIFLFVGAILGASFLHLSIKPNYDAWKTLAVESTYIAQDQMELLDEQQDLLEKCHEEGTVTWFDYLDCYWAYHCVNDMDYCLTRSGFSAGDIYNMMQRCQMAENWERHIKVYGGEING